MSFDTPDCIMCLIFRTFCWGCLWLYHQIQSQFGFNSQFGITIYITKQTHHHNQPCGTCWTVHYTWQWCEPPSEKARVGFRDSDTKTETELQTLESIRVRCLTLSVRMNTIDINSLQDLTDLFQSAVWDYAWHVEWSQIYTDLKKLPWRYDPCQTNMFHTNMEIKYNMWL